jgi:16S rRNA (guanine527-N7)-methyltransferase
VIHVKHGHLAEGASRLGLSLTKEQLDRLALLADLLRDRAIPLGLVAASDAPRIVERHVLDCLRPARLFEPGDGTAVDVGSGAGLPGLVLASVLDASFHLVEPKRRAVGFLELAVERLGLDNVSIVSSRAADARISADVATTRAFGSLAASWEAAAPLLRPGGRLIYFAGRTVDDPVADARGATSPEPPAQVATDRVIASSPPLVIMIRRG